MFEIVVGDAKVVRTHKGGFTVVTKSTKADGSPIDVYVKVWSNTPVTEQQKVTVVGVPSARLSEYTAKTGEKKTVAELHINATQISTSSNAPF